MLRNLATPLLAIIPIIVIFMLLKLYYPDLLSGDHAVVLSTLGTLITLYAATVAVLEIIKARGVAERIFGETKKVSGIMGNFYVIQDIAECQNFLGVAICALEDGVAIPPYALNGIIKVYSKIFRTHISEDNSIHAECRARLYVYKGSSKDRSIRSNTLTTLRTILGQISEAAGEKSAMVENQLLGDSKS